MAWRASASLCTTFRKEITRARSSSSFLMMTDECDYVDRGRTCLIADAESKILDFEKPFASVQPKNDVKRVRVRNPIDREGRCSRQHDGSGQLTVTA